MARTYRILNHNSKRPIIITCEHASKVIPLKYGTLGARKNNLPKSPDLYDVGADSLARVISSKLSARCLIPAYSRMVLNLNKPPDHPKLINDECFGIVVPRNRDVSKKERTERVKNYYTPFHKRLQKEITKLNSSHNRSFFISVHSFFHRSPTQERKLDIGILYKYSKDAGFCKRIRQRLRSRTGLLVEYNQPYSAHKTAGYTINKYGRNPSVNCIEFEVNDKHLRSNISIKKMGGVLSSVLEDAMR
ncbi:N-formylglutamate amidohydrolase [Candidatus Woesearchaeota archaeon]|nr:N-formylglutamate amidohydrolase [Candidatus Woesearchaeota archaeon]